MHRWTSIAHGPLFIKSIRCANQLHSCDAQGTTATTAESTSLLQSVAMLACISHVACMHDQLYLQPDSSSTVLSALLQHICNPETMEWLQTSATAHWFTNGTTGQETFLLVKCILCWAARVVRFLQGQAIWSTSNRMQNNCCQPAEAAMEALPGKYSSVFTAGPTKQAQPSFHYFRY